MTQPKRTRTVAFSRDNLVHVFSKKDVFEKNPDLGPNRAEIEECLKKYQASAAAAGCGCRADARLLFDCFENALARLIELKETKPTAVTNFVHYATNIQPRPEETVILTVYFRKTGVSDVHKYELS
jgi:hypothetical protein